MYSRARNLPRGDTDAEALHKQINNDFEVQEYLHEHQTEQYLWTHTAITLTPMPPSSIHLYFTARNE